MTTAERGDSIQSVSPFFGIGKKLSLAILGVAGFSVMMNFLFLQRSTNLQRESADLMNKGWESYVVSVDINRRLFDQMHAVDAYHELPLASSAIEINKRFTSIDSLLKYLSSESPIVENQLEPYESLIPRLHSVTTRMLSKFDSVSMMQHHASPHAIGRMNLEHQVLMDTLKRFQREVMLLQKTLAESGKSTLNYNIAQSRENISRIYLFSYTISLSLIAIAFIVLFYINQKISNPLISITKKLQSINILNLSDRISNDGVDEIRIFSDNFNRMLSKLQDELVIRQHLEESLFKERRLSAVGLLANGVAHNLQNPLGVIMLSAEQLKRKNMTEKELVFIEESAKKMHDIIRTLLSKSRREYMLQAEPVDLNKLILTEISYLDANTELKHTIEKKLSLDPEIPFIRGFYPDFAQIFGNILNNAIHSMIDSTVKRLEVSSRVSDNCVVIAVRDTGCGISGEQKTKIFDPFFTTKVTGEKESTSPRGTGLGLSSANEIVKKYEGTITVESTVNVGSIFSIILPITHNEYHVINHKFAGVGKSQPEIFM